MRLSSILILSALTFLLFSGALGLRMPEECDVDPAITRNSERMNCYYQAALTVAYLCGTYQAGDATHCDQAKNICDDIWNVYGTASDASNDQKRKAELVSNNCFLEIAKITRDSEYCGYITKHIIGSSVSHQLTGDQVTYDACMDETTRLAALAPDAYYQPGRNNICSIVFVLPLLVFCIISLDYRGRVQ